MKQAIFHLRRDTYRGVKRDTYRGDTTLGKMYNPDNSLFGETLEDTVRGYGIKDKHNTAIPETQGDFLYKLAVRTSPKYGEVAVIYTQKEGDNYILSNAGISFEQILIHGGNTENDTSGCVLIAKNRNAANLTIQGSLKEEIKNKVKNLIAEGFECYLRITNLPQAE